jgi:hypothetical protein
MGSTTATSYTQLRGVTASSCCHPRCAEYESCLGYCLNVACQQALIRDAKRSTKQHKEQEISESGRASTAKLHDNLSKIRSDNVDPNKCWQYANHSEDRQRRPEVASYPKERLKKYSHNSASSSDNGDFQEAIYLPASFKVTTEITIYDSSYDADISDDEEEQQRLQVKKERQAIDEENTQAAIRFPKTHVEPFPDFHRGLPLHLTAPDLDTDYFRSSRIITGLAYNDKEIGGDMNEDYGDIEDWEVLDTSEGPVLDEDDWTEAPALWDHPCRTST